MGLKLTPNLIHPFFPFHLQKSIYIQILIVFVISMKILEKELGIKLLTNDLRDLKFAELTYNLTY